MAAAVRGAVEVRARSGRLVRDAEKRVRALVCGLFVRLAGERAIEEQRLKRQRKIGKKKKSKRKRPPGRKAKRGKAREREVDEFWRTVARADVPDFTGSYFDLSPWRSAIVTTCYSDGSRWVEGCRASVDGSVGVRRAAQSYHSRKQRLSALADAAGIDAGVMASRECRVADG